MNEGDWRHWPKLEDGESLDLWNPCLENMNLAENWTAVNAALMESALSTGTGEPIKEALLACRAIANALPKPEFVSDDLPNGGDLETPDFTA